MPEWFITLMLIVLTPVVEAASITKPESKELVAWTKTLSPETREVAGFLVGRASLDPNEFTKLALQLSA